jgi:hypothetical protein
VAEVAAFSGQLQKAREIHGQAVESAQRGKFRELAATIAARSALREAVYANTLQTRQGILEALSIDRGREALKFAGLAASFAGDPAQATAIADELAKRYPVDTMISNIALPTIRASIEVGRGNSAKAIELLQATVPYEFGGESRVIPNYVRGLAYLKARQGKEAAAEFQRILGHRGICGTSAFCAFSRLQLGRARALTGDSGEARTAYQDFFALWKDADPDVPILKEAKAEYAKLPQ